MPPGTQQFPPSDASSQLPSPQPPVRIGAYGDQHFHSRSTLKGCETTMMNFIQVYINCDGGLRGDQSLGSMLTFSEPSDQ